MENKNQSSVKILAFAGSTRKDSYNKKLVQIASSGAKMKAADVLYIDLRDFPLPLYDEDFQRSEGFPENAKKLKALMKNHDGFLISSPEYNSSISGVLKNAIDWASRPEGDEEPLVCFKGKVATIMSASPGALGGLRGLVTVRSILGNLGMIVLPEQLAISKANEAFDTNGNLKDPKFQSQVQNLGGQLAVFLFKLKT